MTYPCNTLQPANTRTLYTLTNTFPTGCENKEQDQLKTQGLISSPLTISMHKNAPMPQLPTSYIHNS